jgi:hypothetical protein
MVKEGLSSDKDIVKAAVAVKGKNLKLASEGLKGDKEV